MSDETAVAPEPGHNQGEENLFGDTPDTNQQDQGVQPPDADHNVHGNDPNVQPQVDPSTRPEGLPEKFQTVEELAQAYNEMGTKIREKFDLPEGYESPSQVIEELQQLKESNTPPEKYENLKLPEGVDELGESDTEFFKELGLSEEKAQKVMDYFTENVLPAMAEKTAEVEKERLGRQWGMDPQTPEFQDRMAALREWAYRNFPESAVQDMAKSASGVMGLYNMMKAGYDKQQTSMNQQSEPQVTPQQIQSMVNDDRYWNDAAFRAEVERKISQMHKR